MKQRTVYMFIFLVLFIGVASHAQYQSSITEELYGYVLGIEGSDIAKRKAFILDQLQALGIGYVVAPFREVFVQRNDSTKKADTLIIRGENIIARVGTGFKKIVLGAHYDVYEGSPGANDNGSGVAVALGLLKYFRDREMKHSLEVCFFDKEEQGLWGSMNYIKNFAIGAKHLAYINIDVVGAGNEIFIGPIGGGDDANLMPIVREAMRKLPFKYVERSEYPYSDYVPFAAVKLENISISVVPEGDADKLIQYERARGMTDTLSTSPRLLSIIHTPEDRATYVSPHSLKLAFEFVREIVEILNVRR
ncbi:MAG: M28 family metallopeptidase [Bacteroidetes bacterium]|nr:M28 family metallopeptidase [Bacteroidota bacterium]